MVKTHDLNMSESSRLCQGTKYVAGRRHLEFVTSDFDGVLNIATAT
jgi:hypothetical protein